MDDGWFMIFFFLKCTIMVFDCVNSHIARIHFLFESCHELYCGNMWKKFRIYSWLYKKAVIGFYFLDPLRSLIVQSFKTSKPCSWKPASEGINIMKNICFGSLIRSSTAIWTPFLLNIHTYLSVDNRIYRFSSGTWKCKRGSSCGNLHIDLQEPCICHWNAWIYSHSIRCHPL